MKNATIFSLFIIGIALTSCKSTIPERDGITPTITFLVSPIEGTSGESITIPADFDYNNNALFLQNGGTYIVLAVTRDKADPVDGEQVKGSISRATLTVPSDNLINITNYPEDLPSNWAVGAGGGLGATTQTFTFTADPMNIKDGASISPKMVPAELSRGDFYEFIFSAEDHHEHIKTVTLKVLVTNEISHIGDYQ